MDKTFYNKYIKGPKWAAKRELWFNTFGKWCRACGTAAGPIQLHHMTYDRLGRERMNDLVALCANCHREVEALYRKAGRSDRMAITLAYIKARRKHKWTRRTS